MCLGHESLDGSQACELAEHVFAALPWPCLVWGGEERHAILVSASFRREFGLGDEDIGARWLDDHLEPTGQADEFVYRGPETSIQKYRLIRRTIDVPPAALQAVFLMPVPATPPQAPPSFASAFASLRPDVGLTPRETQVLEGIMRGKLNKVIASELAISPKTVELHRANLMAKLRVHNVVELTRAVLDGSPPKASPPLPGREPAAS